MLGIYPYSVIYIIYSSLRCSKNNQVESPEKTIVGSILYSILYIYDINI